MAELIQATANFVDALALLVKMLSFPLMVWLLMKAIRTGQQKPRE
ncbi:hypothetical protein [Aeromonas allosaccharophila]